jgi:hypothetical protein
MSHESTDAKNRAYLWDDFTCGSNETGEVGMLGWNFTNGSIIASGIGASDAGRFGAIGRRSGTTAAQVAALYLGVNVSAGQILFQDVDIVTWVFAPVSSNADFDLRCGLCTDASDATPDNGIYLEKLAADTSYFGVSRASNVQTRTSGLKSVVAGEWTKVEIIKLSSGSVGFSIDGGAQTVLNTNIPSGTSPLVIFFQITPTTTTARDVRLDFFSIRSQLLVR